MNDLPISRVLDNLTGLRLNDGSYATRADIERAIRALLGRAWDDITLAAIADQVAKQRPPPSGA